jgi:anti-anti-sigma factor
MPAASVLSVEVEVQEWGTVIKISGEAGVSNADELSRRLMPVTASHPPLVVFDLAGLRFISSLGLGLLMEFQRGLNLHGGHVRLVNPQPAVHDMLRKCRLDTVLRVAESMEHALTATRA